MKRVFAWILAGILLCGATACGVPQPGTELPSATEPPVENVPPTPEATPEATPEPTPLPTPEPLTSRESALPVLMYHHVVQDGEACNSMTVTVGRFREDLEWLIANGYHFVLPGDLISQEPLPEKPVMISFDDGYKSNYDLAFPLLKELNAKMALALVVSFSDYDTGSGLSWDICREMEASGLVEFGSHTYRLHNLDERGGSYDPNGPNGIERLPEESREEFDQRVIGDLRLSIDTLERELGRDVIYFAYPYGQKEEWAEDFIRENFRVTTVTTHGCADLREDFYDLERYTITMQSGPASVLPVNEQERDEGI